MTTTKPEWFKKFEQELEKQCEKREKFNKKILTSIEPLVLRVENIEKIIDNLIVKNNLKNSIFVFHTQ